MTLRGYNPPTLTHFIRLRDRPSCRHHRPAGVGELELGRRRDDDFADRYRAWLNAA